VLQKTRAECLDAVRNLNLWGSDLTDVSILTVRGGVCIRRLHPAPARPKRQATLARVSAH